VKAAEVSAAGPATTLPAPKYSTDMALRLLRAR
jgi:hypothetical protein